MALLYKSPAIATLVHKETPYRSQWVIDQVPDLFFSTCHEMEQLNGERKVVKKVALYSLAHARMFSTYLSSHGWSQVWKP
jgi:hypothetical protein